MKLFRVIAPLTVSVLVVSGCNTQPRHDTQSDAATPTWSVECPKASGETTEAEDFADLKLPCLANEKSTAVGAINKHPKLITLWASWCKPCADEAPALQKFHKQLGDKVTVLGVNTQDTQDRGKYFAEDFGWTFPSVFDKEGTVMHSQQRTALPATYLIDKNGKTVASYTKGDLTTQDLLDDAQHKLGVTH